MKKLTQERLLEILEEWRNCTREFVSALWGKEDDQAYIQLKEMIQQKPTVTREWVEKKANIFYNYGISEQTGETVRWLKARNHIEDLLKEIGVDVSDED